MCLFFAPNPEHEHPWFFGRFNILEKLMISIIWSNKLMKYEGKIVRTFQASKCVHFFRSERFLCSNFFCAFNYILRDTVFEFLNPHSFKIDSCSLFLKKCLKMSMLLLISRCCRKGHNLSMGTPKSYFWNFFMQSLKISKFFSWEK